MELTRHEPADAFLAHAGEFLSRARGRAQPDSRARVPPARAPTLYGEHAYFAVVEEGGRVGARPCERRRTTSSSRRSTTGRRSGRWSRTRVRRSARSRALSARRRRRAVRGCVAAAEARLGIAQRVFRADHVDAPVGVPGPERDYERSDRESRPAGSTPSPRKRCPSRRPGRARSSSSVGRRTRRGPRDLGGRRPRALAGFGGRRRTAYASARSTRRRTSAAAATGARSPPASRSPPRGGRGSASCSPTSPTRRRTGSTSGSATGPSVTSTSGRSRVGCPGQHEDQGREHRCKGKSFRRARGGVRPRGGRQRDHQRRPGRERPSRGRRAARAAGVLRRHLGGVHRHAHRADVFLTAAHCDGASRASR